MAAYTTVDDAGAYFNGLIYTGSGGAQSITGVGFQLDFGFIRKPSGEYSYLYGPVTGQSGADFYFVAANSSNAASANNGAVASIDSDGWTFQSGLALGNVNTSSAEYMSWNWKAGTTTGIDTTSSTITPSAYSFNQAAGFSVLKYTGDGLADAKLAHGLGAVPEMIWIKNLDSVLDWYVYHKGMDGTALGPGGSPEDYYITLNGTAARVDSNGAWYDTAPTSVNITLGNNTNVNDTEDYVAYCFTGKQGYSKFGVYEGNGNANGTFVYAGFRPAYIFATSIDSTSDRDVFDNKRVGINVDNDLIVIGNTDATNTSAHVDILSNGFKWRISTDPNVAETYIYAAFAESPFVNSNGVPTNAR